MRGLGRTILGLATLALLCAGGWYMLTLFRTGNLEGGEIRVNLRFDDAHGVPVGGAVRHKGVRVGEVMQVDVAPDDSGVLMEVAVQGKFHHTLRKNSRFWIVRPRFGGLTQGVFGLDTLIKDPYVEFDTPDLGSPLLPSGSLVYGLSVAPVAEDSLYYKKEGSRYAPVNFKVRFSRAPGLAEGAPVLYRDVNVGKVVDLDLSLDGRSVEVEVLVEGRYRETVRTDSLFWVAKPNVQMGFSLSSFLNVKDLSKIITGAALAYATPTESSGRVLRKGDILDGVEEPPEDLDELQGPLVSIEPSLKMGQAATLVKHMELAGVSFAFTEEDLLRKNQYLFQGSGLLFRGPDGNPLVLTARTLADGGYSASDWFSKVDIPVTDLKVRFKDRSVVDAEPFWLDPMERDLAVLKLVGDVPAGLETGAPVFSEDGTTEEYYLLIAFREDEPGMIRSQPIPADKVQEEKDGVRLFNEDLALGMKEWCGAFLVDRNGRLVGMVGRRKARSDRAALVVLEELPDMEEPDGEKPE